MTWPQSADAPESWRWDIYWTVGPGANQVALLGFKPLLDVQHLARAHERERGGEREGEGERERERACVCVCQRE